MLPIYKRPARIKVTEPRFSNDHIKINNNSSGSYNPSLNQSHLINKKFKSEKEPSLNQKFVEQNPYSRASIVSLFNSNRFSQNPEIPKTCNRCHDKRLIKSTNTITTTATTPTAINNTKLTTSRICNKNTKSNLESLSKHSRPYSSKSTNPDKHKCVFLRLTMTLPKSFMNKRRATHSDVKNKSQSHFSTITDRSSADASSTNSNNHITPKVNLERPCQQQFQLNPQINSNHMQKIKRLSVSIIDSSNDCTDSLLSIERVKYFKKRSSMIHEPFKKTNYLKDENSEMTKLRTPLEKSHKLVPTYCDRPLTRSDDATSLVNDSTIVNTHSARLLDEYHREKGLKKSKTNCTRLESNEHLDHIVVDMCPETTHSTQSYSSPFKSGKSDKKETQTLTLRRQQQQRSKKECQTRSLARCDSMKTTTNGQTSSSNEAIDDVQHKLNKIVHNLASLRSKCCKLENSMNEDRLTIISLQHENVLLRRHLYALKKKEKCYKLNKIEHYNYHLMLENDNKLLEKELFFLRDTHAKNVEKIKKSTCQILDNDKIPLTMGIEDMWKKYSESNLSQRHEIEVSNRMNVYSF